MDKISEIEKIIGYSFKDKDLLATAFTHSSYAYQYKTKSNEKRTNGPAVQRGYTLYPKIPR